MIEIAPHAGHDGAAALHVKLRAPPDGNWPDFHIYHQPRLAIREGHRYRVSFWVRAEAVQKIVVAFYQPGRTYIHLGGPGNVFEQQIKLAADAGINFVSFPIGLPWPKPGTVADWSAVDLACGRVLQVNPNALLLPRIGMSPPPWWREAHPDDVMQWEDGRRDNAVVASPQYRRDAVERLAALVNHLEEKFGEHIAGYHPNGQNTGEWFYEHTWNHPLNGYAPADLAAWRQWRSARGGMPRCRGAVTGGATCRAGRDLPRSGGRAHADRIGPNSSNRRWRTVFVSWRMPSARHHTGGSWSCFFTVTCSSLRRFKWAPPPAGHYALRRVLDCPDIDVLCSPISYFDRGSGQGAPSMTAAESVALAGKMWLNEDDTHTYLATGNRRAGKSMSTRWRRPMRN